VITALGALLLQAPHVTASVRASLATLAHHQDPDIGVIPNYVSVRDNKGAYHAYADGSQWFVIGHYIYYVMTQDRAFLAQSYPSIQHALRFLRYQDQERIGLISLGEGADWQNMFAVRGKGLYVNVLYAMALRCGAALAHVCSDSALAVSYAHQAARVCDSIQRFFWVCDRTYRQELPHCLTDTDDMALSLLADRLVLRNKPYFLPYFSHRYYGRYLDTLGNLLAILFGIATPEQAGIILSYMSSVGVTDPYPVRAIYPPVYPGDPDWRDYYNKDNLNLPFHYHNGGIWPFIGGFYVATLVQAGQTAAARTQLTRLIAANRLGRSAWECNEWLHGQTGRPLGMPRQAWSAGMLMYAIDCVTREEVPYFQSLPVATAGPEEPEHGGNASGL
jgi:glycogen debranching enzyme